MNTKILRTPEIQELGIPTYVDIGSSGADLRSSEDTIVHAGERKMVKTGVKIALSPSIQIGPMKISFEAQVRPRSGLALKKGITVLNSPGTIDESYLLEIGVILFNTSTEDFEIKKGPIFANLILE